MNNKKSSRGFFIVEVLIVLVLLSLLTLILLPNLTVYTDRAKFADVIRAAASFKPAVEACYLATGSISNCNNDTNGVPPAMGDSGYVSSVTVVLGTISASANSNGGLGGQTYILTPRINPSKDLTWSASGTCATSGLC